MRVCIIGAGLSGMVAARTLAEGAQEVVVLEKSRGPGGRMATRREGPFAFDHGAQYFTVRDARFHEQVSRWTEMGLVTPWPHRIAVLDRGDIRTKPSTVQRYVGVPRMSILPRQVGEGISVHCGVHVSGLWRDQGEWQASDTEGRRYGPFDHVLVSVPAPQAVPLLRESPNLQQEASAIVFRPCWATMVVFPESLEVPFEGAFMEHSPLSWVSRNGSKPGRPVGEAWVLHGSPAWSEAHLERRPDEIVGPMKTAFFEAISRRESPSVHARSLRWRYAVPDPPLEAGFLHDAECAISVCGDWCAGARVEGAFLSGLQAARAILLQANR